MGQMKRLAFLFIAIATPCLAQQSPDPTLSVCQALLSNANAQTIQAAAQAQTLGKRLDEARAELAKLKEAKPKE